MTAPLDRLRASLADRYDLERELGRGGMATVYLARDRKHDREVAVKVVRPEISAVIGAERFLQEIRLTAHLQHPHILPLYDSGSVEGWLYYVMPYVAGESLRALLDRERQLSVERAIALTQALAQALDYAHRQGVIHRDLKPENVLLQDGQPLLADFGIALALAAAGGDRLTQSGISVGTPQYMSPEQAAGERQLDGRTDIYALGCLAYEMLAGVPPHTGPTAQAVIADTMTAEPRPLGVLRRSVPTHVESAIHRALEKVPADRFASASQFAGALAAAGPAGRARGGAPAARTLVFGAATLALGLLAGWVLFGRARVASTPRRRWSLLLPATAPIALTGPLGTWQSALALSPDGAVLAYVAPQDATTRVVVRRLGEDTSVVLAGTDGAYHPFFSPDGTWIGFFSGNELRKVAAAGGSPATLLKVDRPVGAVWASRDSILLMENEGFNMRWVPTSGGGSDSTIALTTQFGTPDLLPGGRWAVGQLSSGQRRTPRGHHAPRGAAPRFREAGGPAAGRESEVGAERTSGVRHRRRRPDGAAVRRRPAAGVGRAGDGARRGAHRGRVRLHRVRARAGRVAHLRAGREPELRAHGLGEPQRHVGHDAVPARLVHPIAALARWATARGSAPRSSGER